MNTHLWGELRNSSKFLAKEKVTAGETFPNSLNGFMGFVAGLRQFRKLLFSVQSGEKIIEYQLFAISSESGTPGFIWETVRLNKSFCATVQRANMCGGFRHERERFV